METKEKYTISEATQLLGFKSRSTLNKRTKATGTQSISYDLDENGTKVIPLVELQRVYPDEVKAVLSGKPNTAHTYTKHSTQAQENTAKNTGNTVYLEQRVDLLVERLEEEKQERQRERREYQNREEKADDREQYLQGQITELTKTISQHTRLLEDHRKTKPETPRDDISKSKTDKLLTSAAQEMNKTLKFIITASFMLLVLVIVAMLNT